MYRQTDGQIHTSYMYIHMYTKRKERRKYKQRKGKYKITEDRREGIKMYRKKIKEENLANCRKELLKVIITIGDSTYFVRFQVLTAASMKTCSLAEIDRSFRVAFCSHHQGNDRPDY
jgi:hypothetical protein